MVEPQSLVSFHSVGGSRGLHFHPSLCRSLKGEGEKDPRRGPKPPRTLELPSLGKLRRHGTSSGLGQSSRLTLVQVQERESLLTLPAKSARKGKRRSL